MTMHICMICIRLDLKDAQESGKWKVTVAVIYKITFYLIQKLVFNEGLCKLSAANYTTQYRADWQVVVWGHAGRLGFINA